MNKKIILTVLFVFVLIILVSILPTYTNAKTIEGYEINDKTIYGVSPTTVYSEFIERVQPDIGCDKNFALYSIENGVYRKVNDGLIKTGMILLVDENDIALMDEYIKNGGVVGENLKILNSPYEVVVLGDVGKDGIHDQRDLSSLIRHIVGLSAAQITDEVALKAADINADGIIDQRDINKSIISIVRGTELKLVSTKQEYNMTLSKTSETVTYPNTTTFTITNPSGGELSVRAKDESIATASISGSTVTITPKKAGTTDIVVTSAATENQTASSATYTITIDKAEGCLVLNQYNEDHVSEGFTTTLRISEHHEGGKISAKSWNNNSARVEVNGDEIIVYGIATDIVSITIKCEATDCYKEKSASVQMYVNKPKYFVKDGQVIDDVFKNFSVDPLYNYLGADYLRLTGSGYKWRIACPDPSQISDRAGKEQGGTLGYRTSASCKPGEYKVHAVMKVTANKQNESDFAIDIFCSFAGAGIIHSYDISENVSYAIVDTKVTIDENNLNEPIVRLGARVNPNCSVDLEVLDFYIYN